MRNHSLFAGSRFAVDAPSTYKAKPHPVVADVVASVAAPIAAPAATARRVELLATATRENLAHGKSWVCSEQQVERGDAHPSFEGELVCYVYAS